MTATTVDSANTARRGQPTGLRFIVAFLAGLLAVLALGAGALYAYDRQYDGRILPGVSVGSVDLSGLAPATARNRLAAAYAPIGDGELVLTAGDRRFVIPWSELDRRIEVDEVVAEAAEIGREGNPIEKVIGEARTAIRGETLASPGVVFDAQKLADRINAAATSLESEPRNASVTVTEAAIELHEGANGASANRQKPFDEAFVALLQPDAPPQIVVEIPVTVIEPWITTVEAAAGKAAAERIAQDINVTVQDDVFTINAATIRSWLRVADTVDGRSVPVLDVTRATTVIEPIAEQIKLSPRNAKFLIGKNNKVVGVTPGRNGRSLIVAATATLLTDTLQARVGETVTPAIAASVKVLEPALTTAEAEQAAPLMTRISTWTTYFPIGEKNGFGANIWIPAQDIDGYVVGPGEWFDFWNAVGPITRARGYRDGGAIINGRTEPTGALAGGICSCSTTLFNAALRAGFQMGSRKNHYYYIDRYPIGLDATVFKSSSGSVQTMSWKNDTQYPVLVRGYRIKNGSRGYVRFDLYSVPNGRKVSFSKPIIRNVRPASDSTEKVSSLPTGQRKRVEFPVDGKDVWVTRTVRNASGAIVHRETYYSHYARITGVVQIGR